MNGTLAGNHEFAGRTDSADRESEAVTIFSSNFFAKFFKASNKSLIIIKEMSTLNDLPL